MDKRSDKIVFELSDTNSDAMILKPSIFTNYDSTIKIFLIEVAAEYSWGQEVLLVINEKIYNVGYLNYAVDIENGESIADYCFFEENQNKILMTFQNVSLINWDNEDEIIAGKDLKFELNIDGIKKVN